MGAVMCGMMYTWKRGYVIFGGWMLYISISYRILGSLANNPDTVEDMYCYGCRSSLWWLWNIDLVRESARASGFYHSILRTKE